MEALFEFAFKAVHDVDHPTKSTRLQRPASLDSLLARTAEQRHRSIGAARLAKDLGDKALFVRLHIEKSMACDMHNDRQMAGTTVFNPQPHGDAQRVCAGLQSNVPGKPGLEMRYPPKRQRFLQ
jgi:hypothetical protein